MNRDKMIEKAARAIVVERFYDTPDAWDTCTSAYAREVYCDMARAALEAVDALPPEPETPPLPTGNECTCNIDHRRMT